MNLIKSLAYTAVFLIGLGFAMRIAAFFFLFGWSIF
jgi:hypothetical protein